MDTHLLTTATGTTAAAAYGHRASDGGSVDSSGFIRTAILTSTVFWTHARDHTVTLPSNVYEIRDFDLKSYEWVFGKEGLTEIETARVVDEVLSTLFSTYASERNMVLSRFLLTQSSITVGLGKDRKTLLLFLDKGGISVEFRDREIS